MQILSGANSRFLRVEQKLSVPPPYSRSVTCNCKQNTSQEPHCDANAINRRQLLLGSAAVVGSSTAGLSSSRPAAAAGKPVADQARTAELSWLQLPAPAIYLEQ